MNKTMTAAACACSHANRIELADDVCVCVDCEAVFEDGGPVEVLPECPAHLRRRELAAA